MDVKTLTNIQQKNIITVQINCPQAAALTARGASSS